MRFRTKCRAWRQVRSVTNIKNHVSIHECPNEADGTLFVDWEMLNLRTFGLTLSDNFKFYNKEIFLPDNLSFDTCAMFPIQDFGLIVSEHCALIKLQSTNISDGHQLLHKYLVN